MRDGVLWELCMLFSIGSGSVLDLLSTLSQIGPGSTQSTGNAPANNAPTNSGQTFALGVNSSTPVTNPLTNSSGGPPSAMTSDMMNALFSLQSTASGNTTNSNATDGASNASPAFPPTQADSSDPWSDASAPDYGDTHIGGHNPSASDGTLDQVASTQASTNANGSTTVTTMFADGSQVTSTTPAVSSSDTGNAVGYFLDQMMRQAQALRPAAGQAVSVSA